MESCSPLKNAEPLNVTLEGAVEHAAIPECQDALASWCQISQE